MIIRLLPKQIPIFWDAIKYACTQADEVDKEDMPVYFNELLHALLSDKAQVFIRLDDNRVLIGMLVTRVQTDKIKGKKLLYLQCLYSWKIQDETVWQEDFIFLKEFAKKEKCKTLTFNSRNSAVWEIAKRLGFKEQTRTYSLCIE